MSVQNATAHINGDVEMLDIKPTPKELSSSLLPPLPILSLPPISKESRQQRHLAWARTCGDLVSISPSSNAMSRVLSSRPPHLDFRSVSSSPSSSSDCPALSEAGDSSSDTSSVGLRTPPRPSVHRFLTPVALPHEEGKKYRITTYRKTVNEQIRVVNGGLMHRKFALISLEESIARMQRSSPPSTRRRRSSVSVKTSGNTYNARTFISPVPLPPHLRHPIPHSNSSSSNNPLRRFSLPTHITGIIPSHHPPSYATMKHDHATSNALSLNLGRTAPTQARTIYDRPHPYHMRKVGGLLPPIKLREAVPVRMREHAKGGIIMKREDNLTSNKGVELWRRREKGKMIQPLKLVK